MTFGGKGSEKVKVTLALVALEEGSAGQRISRVRRVWSHG